MVQDGAPLMGLSIKEALTQVKVMVSMITKKQKICCTMIVMTKLLCLRKSIQPVNFAMQKKEMFHGMIQMTQF